MVYQILDFQYLLYEWHVAFRMEIFFMSLHDGLLDVISGIVAHCIHVLAIGVHAAADSG